jgi:hypothetical protein
VIEQALQQRDLNQAHLAYKQQTDGITCNTDYPVRFIKLILPIVKFTNMTPFSLAIFKTKNVAACMLTNLSD